MESQERCCFAACIQTAQPPNLRVRVWPPSDAPSVALLGHLECFQHLRNPSVEPDLAQEYGRIPDKACCVFCGQNLPIVGIHPFVIEVGTSPDPDRFWAHAGCIQAQIPGLID